MSPASPASTSTNFSPPQTPVNSPRQAATNTATPRTPVNQGIQQLPLQRGAQAMQGNMPRLPRILPRAFPAQPLQPGILALAAPAPINAVQVIPGIFQAPAPQQPPANPALVNPFAAVQQANGQANQNPNGVQRLAPGVHRFGHRQ